MGAALNPRRRGRARPHAALRFALKVGLLALVLAFAIWVNLYAAQHDFVREGARHFGYTGVVAAAAISGFNLVVPVPLIAFLPFFMDVGLQPVPTVALIAVGMTLGDLFGYLIGHAARDVFSPRLHGRLMQLERLRRRRPWLPFLLMFLYAALIPAPNEILVIPLAFLGFPLLGIFSAVLAGNVIFNTLVGLGLVNAFAIM